MRLKTFYFRYRQNNSGGEFLENKPRGIGPLLWIEATDVKKSVCKAEEMGLYFNGVERGVDCPCCGDRWTIPLIGKDEVIQGKYDSIITETVFIHRLDGEIDTLNVKRDS